MKTIWILNHHAGIPSMGAGTRHYDFAKELIQRGYRVFIFASSYIHNKYVNVLEPNETIRIENIDGIHWVWLKTREYKGNGKARILSMVDYYRMMMKHWKQFEQPDVIIGSSVHLFACLAGCRIAKKIGAKSISEIRDLWPETLIQMGRLKRHSLMSWSLFLLEKRVYRKSDRIVVTMPGAVDYIAERGIPREKIVYINNGVDCALFDLRIQKYSVADTPIQWEKGKFQVLYVGAHGAANSLQDGLEALRQLEEKGRDDIHLTMIGDGPLKPQLMEQAREWKLKHISFYSSVSKEYIPAILNQADCLLFLMKDSPLYRFGISPNKLFDYLCSGKPILSAARALNDPVKESGGGLCVAPGNAEEVAQAMAACADMSPEQRKEMGRKGKEYVMEHFDIPMLADRLEKLFS